MTITSKIVENNPLDTHQEIKFPVLAQHKTGFIVLFNSSQCGQVIVPSKETTTHYFGDWVDVTDKEHWTILPNDVSIVLSNSG